MLRIVFPVGISATSAPATWLLRWTVSASYVVAVANIRVSVEIIVVIDVDGVVAAPAGAPTPATAPERSHRHPNAEGNRHSCGIVSCGRIVNGRVGVDGRTVNHYRIIRGYVDDLWVGLLDHDHTLALDDFGFHLLLLGRFQIAGVLCLFAHSLDGIHDIALLRQERVAQVRGPLNVIRQALYDVGQPGQRLNARIPGLLCDSIRECFVFQPRILCQPLLQLDEFERIGGSRESLR
jgi:hypothetical protein